MTIDGADFTYLRTLLFERSAIVLGEDKHYLVESRLRPVARSLGLESIAEIVREMQAQPDSPLAERVVEAMTTNETSWFRDVRPFEALRQRVIPEVIRARAHERRLSIWSAACSTGQEIYTVAMLLDGFPELAHWKVDLLGTDINTEVLERARAGRFTPLEINRGLPVSHFVRYFERDGGHFRIKEPLRDRVRFERMNLAIEWSGLPSFDVILLRNVLIYFDTPTKRRVLQATYRQLSPHGYLMLGTAESTLGIVDVFATTSIAGSVVYRRENA